MKKPIPNYENYFIYDNGDLINEITGKKLEGSIRLNGYREYRLSKDNIKVGFYAHRLVAEAFIPNPDNLPIVNHIDGNKLNNDVSNLEWVSYSDNAKHAHNNNLIKERRKTEYYTEDLPQEEWRRYQDFELYLISNYGRVRNVQTNRILKPTLACGYYKVRLSKNGNVTDKLVHYLVFETFLPEKKLSSNEVIDHIDGNKLNNHINNLRCVSNSENVNSAFYNTKTNKSIKKVDQYDINGNYITTFPSLREAGRQLGLDSSSITKVCKGKVKTCGGFIFKYSPEN